MAITKIIPVKVNIMGCINYVINKDKTEEKTLVSAFGCSPKSAGAFFNAANRRNTHINDTQKPNLAYHFIQSFPPDEEITPEKSHEVGRQYIEELLENKYAYVMSTHVDKGHIHNHFCVCATEMNMSGKKMQNDLAIIDKMRKANDKICEQNGLSVIKNPKGKGKHYKEWEQDKNSTQGSQKSQLKKAIDSAIKESTNWEEFLQKLKDQNIEISQGNSKKYGVVTKYKLPTFDRVCRGYTLGERYTDDKIKERIENRVQFLEQRRHERAEKKANMTSYERKEERNTLKTNHMFNSNVEITRENRGLMNWQKQQNALLFAKIMKEAQEKYGLSFTDFDSRLIEIRDSISNISARITDTREKIEMFRKAINYAEIYKSNKVIYEHYQNADNQEAYFQSHDSRILAFDEADLQLDLLGVPKERINAEYIDKLKSKLTSYEQEIEDLRNESASLTQEQKDLIQWKADVDIYLGKSSDKMQPSIAEKNIEKQNEVL